MVEIVYRPVRDDEAELLVDLHRATYPCGSWSRTIYGSHGIARYLQSVIAYPEFQSPHYLEGAWADKSLVGYYYGRVTPESWHLNYIAVASAYRETGIGRTLFRRWLDRSRKLALPMLTLDVDASDHRVLEWYKRERFEYQSSTWIYEMPLNMSEKPGDPLSLVSPTLLGWEAAVAWQEVYGFSSFEVDVDRHRWSVGRLGDKYFRLGMLPSASIEAVLSKIDPKRKLLLFLDSPIDQSAVAVSHRMYRATKATN